jgi:hypothetical protein
VTFPSGPAFAVLAAPDTPWPADDPTPRPRQSSFRGYTLDDRQRPRLRYAVDGLAVEDFFHERRDDSGRLHLERTLTFPDAPAAGLHLRVAADKSIEPHGADGFAVGRGLLVRLSEPGRVRNAGDTRELLLHVTGRQLRLEYHLPAKP